MRHRTPSQTDIAEITHSLFPYLAAQDGSADPPMEQLDKAIKDSGLSLSGAERMAAFGTWRNYLTTNPETWRRFVAEQKRRRDRPPGGVPRF